MFIEGGVGVVRGWLWSRDVNAARLEAGRVRSGPTLERVQLGASQLN